MNDGLRKTVLANGVALKIGKISFGGHTN